MLGVRLTWSDQGVAVLFPLLIRDVLGLEKKKNSQKDEQKNIVSEHVLRGLVDHGHF